MPKYMIHASYTAEGAKGLLAEGGTTRREAVERAISSLGGRLETFYFTFGEDDAVVIFDAPDNASVVTASLVAGSSGTVRTRTTVLISAEEMDEAAKKAVSYTPPGEG